MGFSVEGRITTTSLSFQGSILRSLIFFVLAFTCFLSVAGAPTATDQELQERDSAGLAWGPIEIGNLKLYLTKPHNGYAGPKFPNANHVNFHVDKKAPKNSYTEVVNMHIVKYGSSGKICLYAWDSVTKKVVFDNCFDNFATAAEKCVSAVKDFVDALLREADFLASIAIIAALVIALAAALSGLAVVAV